MSDFASVKKKLQSYGQQHLLDFFDELPDARKSALLEQIDLLDLDQIDHLVRKYVRNEPAVVRGRIEPPAIIPARPADSAAKAANEKARKLGLELIAAGKIAAFTVAGGQGTRLGFEGPKGCLQVTPVAKKSLFQLFAEQIQAAAMRHKTTIPWYIMTSCANDVPTRAFFRQHRFFGMNPRDVFFLVQGTMPAFGIDGKILLAAKDELALSPNGHGGSLPALRASGALDDMSRRGVQYISYFQVDNPLVKAVDPLFIGLHAMHNAQMSAKVLPKRDPMEKLGNVCLVDGRTTVIEYSDLPEELARACNADGRLRFSAGSIAIHILSRDFVERLTSGGKCELPFHRAIKRVNYVDAAGATIQSEKPNAVKLEMFVFDALPLAEKTVILETLRSEEFSPVKNACGEDSLASCLHDQVRRAADWLEEAGIVIPRDAEGLVAAAIEISPLFADSQQELASKVANITIGTGDNLYLGSRGQTGGLK